METITARYLIERLGDRISDDELGYAEGTLDTAAAIVAEMSDDDLREYDPETWRAGVAVMIDADDSALDIGHVMEVLTACVAIRYEPPPAYTGAEFKALIKSRGLTQQQAADLLGLSLSSVAKRVAGTVAVRPGELIALRSMPAVR